MKPTLNRLLLCTTLLIPLLANNAAAFCGFYVGRAGTELFNKSSKVVLTRNGERTVITMASDYEGNARDFALVVPVPVVLQQSQVHVTDNAIVDHLDAYTAPRLVEYFDGDPCMRHVMMAESRVSRAAAVEIRGTQANAAKALGVTIEAEYSVGEYDILVLSAKQSDGLQTWLDDNGYQVPKKASKVLGSYIKQGMKFFVAKVNLEEHDKRGGGYLRPLQMAFEHNRFMLPIRLGMVNARGPQDMFVFTLTAKGRVETTNYRTVKIPSDSDIPLFVKEEFPAFYQDMFNTAVKRENNKAVFTEYAWDMGWCDPCAADPLTSEELRELGVYWVPRPQDQQPGIRQPGRPIMPRGGQNVFVTRLHVRYDDANFPEDLMLQETSDRQNFQGRYVLRHPFKGSPNACEHAEQYYAGLPKRYEKEAGNLANLTGWSIDDIRGKMQAGGQSFTPPKPVSWWEELWGGGQQ